MNRKDWFIERIGKKVYRTQNGCTCKVCSYILENGVSISDKLHASYMADIEADYNQDGDMLKYFDTKEEVTEYQEKHPTFM